MPRAIVVMLIAAISGCGSTDEIVPAPVVHTPLELDPLEDIELGAWWSNDSELMLLAPDGRYMVWDGLNRYRAPVERGRWSRDGYALLWLETYALRPDRLRVSIAKDAGKLVLDVPGRERLRGLSRPPAVREDAVLGAWTGNAGELHLDPTMRYRLIPGYTLRAGQPIANAGHAGHWWIEGDGLHLRPDSPTLDTLELELQQRDTDHLLVAPDQVFRQVREDASR